MKRFKNFYKISGIVFVAVLLVSVLISCGKKAEKGNPDRRTSSAKRGWGHCRQGSKVGL